MHHPKTSLVAVLLLSSHAALVPASCYAPAVLVRAFDLATGTAGAWFAADGF